MIFGSKSFYLMHIFVVIWKHDKDFIFRMSCGCYLCLHRGQVTTLDAVPDIEMLIYLPEILDGLLIILGDQNQEIRQMWANLD